VHLRHHLLLLLPLLLLPFRCRAAPAAAGDAAGDAFWAAAAQLPPLTILPSDASLPPLNTSTPAVRRVAVCVTGGARGFPIAVHGIVRSIKANLVDALDANVTDFFYVLELTSETDHGGKGGFFNYSVADLRDAFAVLPPKAALLSRRFASRCGWVCYTQFDKLASCLALIQQAEAEEGWRYDFVIRQRPDMRVIGRFPPVWALKRALYAESLQSGALGDMSYHAHRDFAAGALGMVRRAGSCAAEGGDGSDSGSDAAVPPGCSSYDYFRRGGDRRACASDARFGAFMRDSGCGAACECWLKASARLAGAVVVNQRVHQGVVRLPKA
jgi:hypothetical protein